MRERRTADCPGVALSASSAQARPVEQLTKPAIASVSVHETAYVAVYVDFACHWLDHSALAHDVA